jgi:hypothetical protein
MRHELTGFTFAGLPDGQISELAVQVNWLSSPIRKNFPLCQGPNHVDIPRRPDPPGQSSGAWRVPRIRMRRGAGWRGRDILFFGWVRLWED